MADNYSDVLRELLMGARNGPTGGFTPRPMPQSAMPNVQLAGNGGANNYAMFGGGRLGVTDPSGMFSVGASGQGVRVTPPQGPAMNRANLTGLDFSYRPAPDMSVFGSYNRQSMPQMIQEPFSDAQPVVVSGTEGRPITQLMFGLNRRF